MMTLETSHSHEASATCAPAVLSDGVAIVHALRRQDAPRAHDTRYAATASENAAPSKCAKGNGNAPAAGAKSNATPPTVSSPSQKVTPQKSATFATSAACSSNAEYSL